MRISNERAIRELSLYHGKKSYFTDTIKAYALDLIDARSLICEMRRLITLGRIDGVCDAERCRELFEKSKEYEDRAITQQHVQPENCQRVCRRKECVYWVNDLCGFRGDCSRAISG